MSFLSPEPDPAADWLEVDRWLTGTRDEPEDEYELLERRHMNDFPHLPASASPEDGAFLRGVPHLAATADLSLAVAATVPSDFNTKEQT